MTDKKIVIICPYLFRLTRGIERFCISLAGAFVEKGYRVVIYAWGTPDGVSCGEINSDIMIRKVPYCRWYQDYIAGFFYRIWLRMDNPAATILNFLYHGEIMLPKKRKYLYVLHSPASQVPPRYRYLKSHIGAFENIHVVAISKMVEEEARPYVGDTPMSLIYNGTDTSVFKPATVRNRGDKLRIITAAAFEERKGMHYLIKALAGYERREQVVYDIYGSGDARYGDYLAELIREHGLEGIVSLKGSVTNIAELLPTYDLFALPSKGEAFALSPIEALACGVPILVSDCPPYPEFVKKDFGCMVNRESVDEIRSFLNSVIEDRQLLDRMSEAALREGQRFSWGNIVSQYLQIINN